MARGDLSDQQYELIKELLPSERSGRVGRPWRDHRTMINGIRWILRTGAPWRDLPVRYAPWQSVYDRLVRWRKDGTWSAIVDQLQAQLQDEGMLDHELWMVDATCIRASRAAAGGGKKGGPMNPIATHSDEVEEGLEPSSTFSVMVKVSP